MADAATAAKLAAGERATMAAQPPYRWVTAHQYNSKEFRTYKREAVRMIQEVMPSYGENDVRLIQIVNVNCDVLVHIGLFKEMSWAMFKQYLNIALERKADKLPFEIERLEDVAITPIPLEFASGIDDTKHDLFTVIPDNVIVFLNQAKVDGKWRFF